MPSSSTQPMQPMQPMPRVSSRDRPSVVASSTALPPHAYGQRELARHASQILAENERSEAAIARFFDHVGVKSRHLALPLEAYAKLDGFADRNRAYIAAAVELGASALRSAFAEAQIDAKDVSLLMTTTVTGVAVPSIDARLMNILPFSTNLKRMPLFGLGCLGGAAGLARVAEYLRAFPDEIAVLLSVELCSLTFQRGDASVANLVSAGLFGDGAAAIVLQGSRCARSSQTGQSAGTPATSPRVVASRSVFFPDTERVMGWDVLDTGFKVVLSPDVPAIVEANVPHAVDGFLHDMGLRRSDIASWIIHPGGPKVIAALESSLGLDPHALDATREGLASVGNLSSASVLFLLDQYRRHRAPPAGSYGLLMAMGPAFCAEMVLLQW
ncbi:3-oxoacyl-[acyl-carrier-protein] synthase III C-terminal domain-containing protein [soil metagenome]